MTKQWMRTCRLFVGKNDGVGLDLSALRCTFSINKGNLQSPNFADITIYNPSPDTVLKIHNEYTRISLSAGYEGNFGLLFDGEIRWKRYGRSTPTTTYVHLQAGEGDLAGVFSLISHTMPSGYTQKQVETALIDSFGKYGLTKGYTPDYAGTKAPRRRTIFGLTRDHFRVHMETNDVTASVQGQKVQVVRTSAYKPGEAVRLTEKSGLIGMPQLTFDGLQGRCLLNPQIEIDGRIHIDLSSIQDVKFPPTLNYGGKEMTQPRSIAVDGFYRVLWLEHQGDTWGNEWYTSFNAAALVGQQPMTQVAISQGAKP